MHKILNVYKPIGKTPLEAINLLKQQHKEYKDVPITYAGRLDPLAHGVLILLVDEQIQKKQDYLRLPKEYEFEALLGVSTDTYDVLGIVEPAKKVSHNLNVNSIVNSFVTNSLNKTIQTYPPFSSKTVKGKPLFTWAKEGKLSEIQIPQREIVISELHVIETRSISREDLAKKVYDHIDLVHGDFRQKQSKESWQLFFKKSSQQEFQVLKFRIHCSSGTYIRGLIHDLGCDIGCGAIALDIQRTAVGTYVLSDSQMI